MGFLSRQHWRPLACRKDPSLLFKYIALTRGAAQDRGSMLASNPAAPGSIIAVSLNFSHDVAELN